MPADPTPATGWLRTPLGATWPDPADPHRVEWTLRYAPHWLSDVQRMWAASAIGAYKHLIESPLDLSRRDLSMLRREIKGANHG